VPWVSKARLCRARIAQRRAEVVSEGVKPKMYIRGAGGMVMRIWGWSEVVECRDESVSRTERTVEWTLSVAELAKRVRQRS
jgi:hypothetical protein